MRFSFINLTPEEDVLRQVIDLVKFQFLIGGHDFVELSNLKWSDIKVGRIKHLVERKIY